ncbi:cyclin-K-like [Procambarus clarkii]|uniref:cyclin-K-like n=1 Tax=Procambarus clarkii TaxID=6728 RepID=UPI0037449981
MKLSAVQGCVVLLVVVLAVCEGVHHHDRVTRSAKDLQDAAPRQPETKDEVVAASSAQESVPNATTSAASPIDAPPEKRESFIGDLPASDSGHEFDTDRKGLFFNFHPPVPRRPRPPPHRPPKRPHTFHPPVPRPHPSGEHPPLPNHGPPLKPDFPDFDFDFDPPNFFDSVGLPYHEGDSFDFGPVHEDVDFFDGPHSHEENFPPFPTHPEQSPLPPSNFFPDFDKFPTPDGPLHSDKPSSFHSAPFPGNLLFITQASIYRDDVPVKEVHNERDKIHPGLDPGGVKGLNPDFLYFLEEQTKAYVNTEPSVDFD